MSASLSAATIVVSLGVAYGVNGSLTEDVRILDLERWGGVTGAQILGGEVWRVATAQLVHVKMAHMLFNAICLFLVGAYVESIAGGRWVLGVWLVAGGIATVLSPVLVEPPYNVGTGASQAVVALGGFALIALLVTAQRTPLAIAATLLALVPPFLIDLAFVGHPKPGHIAGLVLGLALAFVWHWREKQGPHSSHP